MGKDESLISKELIDEYLLGLNKKYGIHDGITLIGVGNHGGGAIKADVEPDASGNAGTEFRQSEQKETKPASF